MRYTKYDPDLDRFVVPLIYKEDGTHTTFHVKTGEVRASSTCKGKVYTGKEPDIVFGEVIDRLAQLENKEEPLPLIEKAHEFFIQGYLFKEVFLRCPSCGLNYGNRDHIRKIARVRYCEGCGQKLKWPKEKKR